MGRPIGSIDRQTPFNDALLMTLRSNPLALRRIAAKLVERAEEGDLAAIREIADRLDEPRRTSLIAASLDDITKRTDSEPPLHRRGQIACAQGR